LPLVQKQWEILVPLRGQIVERATLSLRDPEPRSEDSKESQTVREHVVDRQETLFANPSLVLGLGTRLVGYTVA
jgi:hypothetical protein